MSLFSILILCLVFGLLIESEAMSSRQRNDLQHHRRGRQSANSQLSNPLDAMMKDMNELQNHVQHWLDQAEPSMRNITLRIESSLAAMNLTDLKKCN
jgi:hypothetical protein